MSRAGRGDAWIWGGAFAASTLALGLGGWAVLYDKPREPSPAWEVVVRLPVPEPPVPLASPDRPELAAPPEAAPATIPSAAAPSAAAPSAAAPSAAAPSDEPEPVAAGQPPITEPEPGAQPPEPVYGEVGAESVTPAALAPAAPVRPPPRSISPIPPVGRSAPWIANALPGAVTPGHPAVAIVIDDMGLDRKRSARTVGLPGPLTLSWLPYADDLPAQTAAGRAAGHELMLHLPMEPSVKADPGPRPLLVSLEPDESLRRLDWALSRVPGIVGVNNHMGSRFTADQAAMTPVLTEIARRGYLWLDSKTTAQSVGPALADALAMPWTERDVFLDHVMLVAEVDKALSRLEAVARKSGMAVAIGHPHDATLNALSRWLPGLARRGVTLVPLSAIVRARYARESTSKAGVER